ncbi:MAG: thermonuclease family protein [Melioribacteraceae bacterium]|nr:thermonuclease family protein [Melioribacteraceae bacterium]MCF8353893.1 thermonuclease family protein [Melioribacteraceae bacterium]MCF8392649.1 thermonuclease family protein [Melioribacteraceae bacterium]MCF8417670.1 thermonuclease family protein [Melioribacteraceae bacterium]
MFLRNSKYDLFLIILLLLIFILALRQCTFGQIPLNVSHSYQTTARVARVIDGDTFVLSDSQRVRLLGVDTPEINAADSLKSYFANRAKFYLDSLISKHVVKLTFENKTRDFFGRLLAHVWLIDKTGKDSLFIQAELLKRGYARIRYYPKGSRYYGIFYNLRRTAMKNNLGIWSR